jgi:hypothetical protein
VGFCEEGNEPPGGTKGRDFVNKLSEHYPVMTDSGPSDTVNSGTSLEITNENMQTHNLQLICGRYVEGNACITQVVPRFL